LPELDPIKKSPNVARDRVRSHDERRVKRMDVFACHRTLGMADQGRDGYVGKTEIVGDAREAMTQDVGIAGVLDEVLPMVREAAERVVRNCGVIASRFLLGCYFPGPCPLISTLGSIVSLPGSDEQRQRTSHAHRPTATDSGAD
jgi:hypothetical protein